MVGFWTTDVAKIGERFPLGPCGPMPKEDEAGCTWHHLLRLKKEKTTVSTSRIALAVPTSPLRLLPVHKVSPAWDHVPSVGEGGSSAGGGHDEGVLEFPDDVDQRFFVRSMHDFQAHLIERALASGGGSDGCFCPPISTLSVTVIPLSSIGTMATTGGFVRGAPGPPLGCSASFIQVFFITVCRPSDRLHYLPPGIWRQDAVSLLRCPRVSVRPWSISPRV